MPEKTIFQKIIDREIPATIEYEDDQCLAFRDIAPQAPTHLLVIPKKLIVRIGESADADAALLGHLMLIARKMGNQFGGENGFRLVINNGPDGGEAVPHLHIHVLAGRSLQWPPG
ncbi:histidine triad nucleotide-binding protein [Cerasicoccus frondis]|uniref:histidine triad nucleotide-binding protein n=1 Tax=Cerasicoccus frondis TaxID=490090 RepID=UPI0028524CB8|nr:histidine triad nucleotide-binding protein [Cerasicoccus frondis]